MDFASVLFELNSSGWLSLLGVVLTLLGFGFTLAQVLSGKGAAERAERSANEAVEEIQKLKTLTDLSSAISELEGVRRLLRENSVSQLSERLALVRKLLIGIGARHGDLVENDAEQIRQAVLAFADIEKDIDRHQRGKVSLKPEKINDSLIDQIDRLVEIISGLT